MTAHNSVISDLKNIVELIECDGQITLGHVAPVRNCVATATDEAQCLAMLVRRDGETLDGLLQRRQVLKWRRRHGPRCPGRLAEPQELPIQRADG